MLLANKSYTVESLFIFSFNWHHMSRPKRFTFAMSSRDDRLWIESRDSATKSFIIDSCFLFEILNYSNKKNFNILVV